VKRVADVFSALTPVCPSPRCGHAMVAYQHRLFVFGGCDRLPLLNGEWIYCDFSNAIWEFQPPPQGFNLLLLRSLMQESESSSSGRRATASFD
jgi:hypothetical protein